MAKWEETGRILVGLAGEITNNGTSGLQNNGPSCTNEQVYQLL